MVEKNWKKPFVLWDIKYILNFLKIIDFLLNIFDYSIYINNVYLNNKYWYVNSKKKKKKTSIILYI